MREITFDDRKRSWSALTATSRGDFDTAAKYVAAGVDPNATDSSGRTLVAIFSESGSYTGLHDLIAQGGNVNQADGLGFTPVMRASKTANYNSMRMLAGNNADVNKQNAAGETALMICVQQYYKDASWSLDLAKAVDILIEAGANPFLQDVEGKKALDLFHPKNDAQIKAAIVSAMKEWPAREKRLAEERRQRAVNTVENGASQHIQAAPRSRIISRRSGRI